MMGGEVPVIGDSTTTANPLTNGLLRRGTGKVPHQSGNVGFAASATPSCALIEFALKYDNRAHRRQLGFAGPIAGAQLMEENAQRADPGKPAWSARGADPLGAGLRATRVEIGLPASASCMRCKVSGCRN